MKVSPRRLSVLFIFLIGFLGTVKAQSLKNDMDVVLNKPVQHKYKAADNIFFGGSVGLNYSMSDFVRKENFLKMLRPQFDFTFGKFYNKWFAGRVGLGFMSQEASIPQEVQKQYEDYGYEPYNFWMFGAKVDAMLSLNRIFRPYRYDEPFQMWAFGGIDGYRTFGFQSKVKEWNYPIDHKGEWGVGWHAGLEAQFRTGDHYSITLSAAWHQAGRGYNGQDISGSINSSYVTFGIGFVYRFTNSHGEIGFHDCSHHENYYFDEMNRRIAKYYRKNGITAPGQQDSIICFPIHYSYLTPMQKEKLDKLSKKLELSPSMRVHIDVYSDGNESPVYNEFRAENREESILTYMQKAHPGLSGRIIIQRHSEASPIPPAHMWSRAGIIRIE